MPGLIFFNLDGTLIDSHLDLAGAVTHIRAAMGLEPADAEDRIVDLEADILEIITPNHDGAEDNALAGWPGNIYNSDADGDGVVEGQLEQTAESFTAELPAWRTKRMLGDHYKMNSGTWTQEMDLYQGALRGKTAALRQIVGCVMRSTAGRADPVLTEELVRQALESMNKT